MPISDASYMLRLASVGLLDGVETGVTLDIGPSPLSGMLVRIYLPLDGTSLALNFADSPDDSSWTDLEGGAFSFPVGAITYLKRIFWTERYLRLEVTECTGSYGNATLGLVHGAEPT